MKKKKKSVRERVKELGKINVSNLINLVLDPYGTALLYYIDAF